MSSSRLLPKPGVSGVVIEAPPRAAHCCRPIGGLSSRRNRGRRCRDQNSDPPCECNKLPLHDVRGPSETAKPAEKVPVVSPGTLALTLGSHGWTPTPTSNQPAVFSVRMTVVR
jgi:hypothetical protein